MSVIELLLAKLVSKISMTTTEIKRAILQSYPKVRDVLHITRKDGERGISGAKTARLHAVVRTTRGGTGDLFMRTKVTSRAEYAVMRHLANRQAFRPASIVPQLLSLPKS